LVFDVRVVLHGEKINEAAEYEVKDVIFIDAEVISAFLIDGLSEIECILV